MDWFTTGIIWGQSIMLCISGYMLSKVGRIVRRQNDSMDKGNKLLRDMLDHIYFQQGVIAALQAGVIGPWNLNDVDYRNLPIELRIKILVALLDIGIEAHRPPS